MSIPMVIKDTKGNVTWEANVHSIATSAVPSSVTGTTSETVLQTVVIPGGLVGPNDRIEIHSAWTFTNSANTKNLRIKLGGLSGTQYLNQAATTTASFRGISGFQCRNSVASQVGISNNSSSIGLSGNAFQTSTVDLSQATTIVFTGELANTGETITLESYNIILYQE